MFSPTLFHNFARALRARVALTVLGLLLVAMPGFAQASPQLDTVDDSGLSDDLSNDLSDELNDDPVSDGLVSEEPIASKAKPAENVDLSEVIEDPSKPNNDSTAPEDDSAPTAASDLEDALIPLPQGSNIAIDRLMEDSTGAELDAKPSVEVAATQEKRPLIVLDSEVLPGTTARLAWSPNVSFLEISAPTSVLVVNGLQPGPRLCLTAALHGDEINGIETVRRVLYSMDPQTMAGAVIGVPIVNLQGFRAGSRYLADRRDLNRYFPGNPKGSAASRIAFSFFKEIISQCDVLIDLHTGSFRRDNLPQLRADLSYPAIQELSQNMGRIVVLQSTGAKGTLRRAASELGVPAVTLEAGAPNELNNEAVEDSVRSIEAALAGLGIVDNRKSRRRTESPVYYQSTWIRANEGGILISTINLGDKVQPGDVLGAVTNPITNQRSEIRSPAKGRIIGMALNQVMHPGFAAYHLGIDPVAVEANAQDLIPENTILLQSDSPEYEDIEDGDPDDEDPDDDQGVSLTVPQESQNPANDILILTEDSEAGR